MSQAPLTPGNCAPVLLPGGLHLAESCTAWRVMLKETCALVQAHRVRKMLDTVQERTAQLVGAGGGASRLAGVRVPSVGTHVSLESARRAGLVLS